MNSIGKMIDWLDTKLTEEYTDEDVAEWNWDGWTPNHVMWLQYRTDKLMRDLHSVDFQWMTEDFVKLAEKDIPDFYCEDIGTPKGQDACREMFLGAWAALDREKFAFETTQRIKTINLCN
jgi:hypothetical protein